MADTSSRCVLSLPGRGPVAGMAVLLMMLAALLCAPAPALAQRLGSISVDVRVSGPDGEVTLVGDSFAIAQVATADISWNGDGASVAYRTLDAFAGVGGDWSATDSDALREAARAASRVAAREGLYVDEQTVGEGQSRVTFSGLEPGLYLVARRNVAEGNRGFAVDPTLVGVPTADAAEVAFDVPVEPKYEWRGEGERPMPGPGGSMPQTGDYLVLGTLGLLAALGAGLVVGGRLSR